jgi:hypothetical protein
MIKKLMFVVLACSVLSSTIDAQSNFWKSSNAYLRQNLPNDTPKIFAKDILADSGIVLGRVGFSEDGKEFYYGYAQHWFDSKGSGIKQIVYDGKKWIEPQVIVEDLAIPTLSVDNAKLFFNDNNSRIWQSERVNSAWTAPVVMLDKPYGLYNFQPTRSGTYYVASNANQGNKNDYTTYDFCTLTISGNHTVIKSLGKPLNTPGFDGDFFVAPDESYMIISAKETKDYDCELFISFRKRDHSWTNPKSLGPLVNDGVAHRFGQYVSPDGKYLFYTKGTSEKDTHIYWMRFDKLLQKLKGSTQ